MDDPFGRWLLTALCAALCAFATLCRSVVKNAGMARLEEEAAEDHRLASWLKMLSRPGRVLTAMSLTKVFCVLMIAALQTLLFARGATFPAFLVSLILTLIVTALCLTVPDRLGESRADEWILSLRVPMMGITWALILPVLAADLISYAFGKLLGLDLHAPEQVTEEDILTMVDSGEEAGTIESNERDLIENVFDFSDTTASDCMTHRTDVTAIEAGENREEILSLIRESGLSRFPVYEGDIDHVIGVLFARDYLINMQDSHPRTLNELLREPYFVPETVAADVLFRDMQKRNIHIAIVVDEYGGMSGLITLEDLLEELVGNIYDEFDKKEEEPLVKLENGSWRADGSVDIETLCESLDIRLPESEDYDTLGGLIFSHFTQIPRDDARPELDVLCTGDGKKPEEGEYTVMHIRVEKIAERRVETALLTLRTEKEQEEKE